MRPETAFKDATMTALRDCGAWTLKLHGGRFQSVGVDLYFMHHSRPVAMELKAEKGINFVSLMKATTDLQLKELSSFRHCGGRAFLAGKDTSDGIIVLLELLAQGDKIVTVSEMRDGTKLLWVGVLCLSVNDMLHKILVTNQC